MIEVSPDLPQFKAYDLLEVNPNNIEELAKPFQYKREDGKKVVEHNGAHYYTVGQRKGLHIGGRPQPSFVIGIDIENNIVFSGQTEEHPGLNRWALKLQKDTMNWINSNFEMNTDENLEVSARIRYRQPLKKAHLIKKNGQFFLLFEKKQKGVAPGQFAAWYKGEELIGSAVIES